MPERKVGVGATQFSQQVSSSYCVPDTAIGTVWVDERQTDKGLAQEEYSLVKKSKDFVITF